MFKYNPSSTEAKSLRKGNFYIGTGDVGKGPSSETGFYNGVIVGTFSYVMVLHRGDNVPSFYQIQNDAELIERTNQIDTSVVRTTKEECFSYFAGQSDKMIVNRDYDTIVTDGLVLNVDMSYLSSYPATDSSWRDLSPNQNNGTLVNSPIFSSNGWIQFDGQDEQVNIPNSASVQVTGDQTLEFIVYPERRDRRQNWYDKAYGGEGTITYETSGQLNYYWGTAGANNQPYQGVGTSGSPLSTLNRWYHVVLVRELSTATKTVKWYINGVLNATSTASYNAAVASTTQIRLGVGYTNFFLGRMSIARQYNISLSQSQVLQHYYKGPIVTSGLTFSIDAGNLVSYDVFGSTWSNLSGTLYNGTFQNSPTYSSVNNGVIDFDGTSAWVQIPTYTFGNGNWTCNAWVQGDVVGYSSYANIVSNSSGGPVSNAMGIVSSKIHYANYDGAWKFNPGNTTLSAGRWYMLTWVNYAGASANLGTMKMFVDGLPDSSVFNSYTTNGGPCNAIGRNWTTYFNGRIGLVQFYNKSLSDSEVTQNFNTYRSRFGI